MTAGGFLGELWVTIGVDSSGLANATVALKNMQNASQTVANATNKSLGSVGAAANKTASTFNNSLNSISNNLYRFGTFATMAFTLPLAAIATLGVKSAMELEQIKQKTVALANVSQTQMDAWSGAITRIGIATNASSKSIAQSLYFVSSAGVDNANAMKMVEYAAKGTAAGLGETDVIAKLLTYTYNAYGKEAFDVAKIMDSLTVAVREGAAEAGEITEVMGDLIPIGAQLGVSFDQIAGSIAAMTQVGLNAHKAATGLRQIMVQLIKPHHDAADALDKAAIKMGDASIASRNLTATINNKGLLETLFKIKEAAKNMGPMFLPTVFSNVRAFNAFMAEVGPNIDKVREIMRRTANETGAFENALSIMMQTSQFKFDKFKKAWELAMIDLGKGILPALLPILDSLIEKINNLTSWFKSLSSSSQTLIIELGLILAMLGPITIALSGLVRLWAILGMAMTGMIVPAIHAVGSALVWLSGFMLANPYIVAGAAIILFVQALTMLSKKTNELTEGQKILKSVEEKATQSIISEKVAIEQLLMIATNQNATWEQKEKALKTLNAISPEYLDGINEETLRTGEATRAIDRYIKSLELKAKQQILYDRIVEENKKRTLALSSGSDKELKGGQIVEAALWGPKREAMLQIENASKATKEFNDIIKLLWDSWKLVPYEIERVERAAIKTKEVLSIYPAKGSVYDPITYFTTAKYLEDMYGIMLKYNYLVNNKKGKNIPETPPEDPSEIQKAFDKYTESLQSILIKMGLFKNEARQFGFELKLAFDFVGATLSAKQTYFDVLTEKGKGATAAVKELAKEIEQLKKRAEYQDTKTMLMALRGSAGTYMNDKTNGFNMVDLGYSVQELDGQFVQLGKVAIGTVRQINDGLKISNGGFASMSRELAYDVAYWQQIKDITKQYYESLDENQTKAFSNGRSGHLNPWKMQLDDLKSYVNFLKQLESAAIQNEDLGGYLDAANNISILTERMEKMTAFQKFNYYFQQIGQQMNNMITSFSELVKIQQNKSYEFIDNVAKREGKSAEWVAHQKEMVDRQYFKKLKAMSIAQAVINGALAITNIWAHTADPTGVFLKIALSVLSAANTAAQIAVISGQGMAQGGIVPSGYNNDTYPALLSSGEVVVPPHKLPNMLGAGKQTIVLEGELVARGKDLVYIFQQQSKLMNSY